MVNDSIISIYMEELEMDFSNIAGFNLLLTAVADT